MFKNCFSALILLTASFSSIADELWYSHSEIDDFSGEKSHNTYSYSVYQSDYFEGWQKNYEKEFGLRCDVSKVGDQDFMLTFSVPSAIATPRSAVEMMIKVDDQEPLSFEGNLFSNSYQSGYILMSSKNETNIAELITKMKAGSLALVRVNDLRNSEIVDMKISLKGFTKSSKDALSACGISGLALSAEDLKRLQDIEGKIQKLAAEKKSILEKA